MKISTYVATAILTACCTTTHAQSFRNDLQLFTSERSNDSFDLNTVTGAYNHYFQAVDETKGPLAEAVFLNRSNTLGVVFSRGDIDNISIELETAGLTSTLHFGESGAYVNLAYATQSIDYGSDFSPRPESDEDRIFIGAGYYVTDSTALSFNVTTGEIDTTVGTSSRTDDVSSIEVAVKSLQTVSEGKSWFGIEASFTQQSEENGSRPDRETDTFAFGVDFYPSTKANIGLFLEDESEDDLDTLTTGIRGRYFINPMFSINASFASSDVDDSGDDFDEVVLGLGLRF